MLLSIALFDRAFTNIVAISFTALILNELLVIAYEIRTWCVVHTDSLSFDLERFLIAELAEMGCRD